MQSLQRQVIRRAREIIADPAHWLEGHFAVDAMGGRCTPACSAAVRFCAIGALWRAASEIIPDAEKAQHAANTVVDALEHLQGSYQSLKNVNDRRGHKAVLEIFDKALAS
jgi:hypothetical protein